VVMVAGAANRAAGLAEAPPPSPAQPTPADAAREIASALTTFKSDSGRAIAGILPVGIRVPEFGATLFAAAELTAEGRAPAIEFDYKKTGRR
jgi:hypothetical protein